MVLQSQYRHLVSSGSKRILLCENLSAAPTEGTCQCMLTFASVGSPEAAGQKTIELQLESCIIRTALFPGRSGELETEIDLS